MILCFFQIFNNKSFVGQTSFTENCLTFPDEKPPVFFCLTKVASNCRIFDGGGPVLFLLFLLLRWSHLNTIRKQVEIFKKTKRNGILNCNPLLGSSQALNRYKTINWSGNRWQQTMTFVVPKTILIYLNSKKKEIKNKNNFKTKGHTIKSH